MHEKRLPARSREWFDALISSLRAHAQLGARPADRDAAGGARDPRPDRLALCRDPQGLLPGPGHRPRSRAITEAPQSISYAAMAERQQALAEIILKDPDVDSLSSFIGVDGTNTTLNSGRMLINLKPHDSASRDVSDDHAAGSRGDASGPRHLALYAAGAGPDHRRHGQPDAVPVRAAGRQSGRAGRVDAAAGGQAQDVAGARDVASDMLGAGARGLSSRSTAITAARFGITPATIDNALYDAFGQRIVSTIFTNTNQIPGDSRGRSGAAELARVAERRSICRHRPDNGQVPLSVIAKVREQTAPLQIDHLGQFPAATVSFNLAPGASLGAAVDAIKRRRQEIGLPRSVITSFLGAALAFQSSLTNELFLILAAIVTVYIVLGVLYESFIHPLTILSTLPSAGIGALLALMQRATISPSSRSSASFC